MARAVKALKLDPLDAMVSNAASLRDKVEQARVQTARKFSERTGLEREKAYVLLSLVDFNFQKALKAFDVLR